MPCDPSCGTDAVPAAIRMALAIDIEQLWKSYDGQAALQGLSLQAFEGEIVGLIGPNGDETIASLSKGMKAKIAFAAAILHDPRTLILDEPLIGIDPAGQHRLKDRLMSMARAGGTVLVSTHQLDTAERLCKRVAIVHHGRNVATGDLAALRAQAHIDEAESLEEIFLRLTEEAQMPPVEAPRRRLWFRRS